MSEETHPLCTLHDHLFKEFLHQFSLISSPLTRRRLYIAITDSVSISPYNRHDRYQSASNIFDFLDI